MFFLRRAGLLMFTAFITSGQTLAVPFKNLDLSIRSVTDPSSFGLDHKYFHIRDNGLHTKDTPPFRLHSREISEQESLTKRSSPYAAQGLRYSDQDVKDFCAKGDASPEEFLKLFAKSGKTSTRLLFWSGIKDSVAMDIGRKLNRVTLEMLVKPDGKSLLSGCKETQGWWNNASEAFARWSRGGVAVVFSPQRHQEILDQKSKATWVLKELPALISKYMPKSGTGQPNNRMRKIIKMYIGTDPAAFDVNTPAKDYDGPLS